MAVGQRPFPELLRDAFDAESLERVDTNIAVIDDAGSILWVNAAWSRFALANGGASDLDDARSYFDAITPPLRDFYRSAFANALATGDAFDHEYECSSPDKHRLYHLRALPVDARALLLEHSLVTEAAHDAPSHEAIEARYVSGDGTVLQCSHCRRIRAAAAHSWDWVKQWVVKPHPRTSHGICPSCVGFYWGRSTRK